MSFLGICDQIRLVKISKYHNKKQTKNKKMGILGFWIQKLWHVPFSSRGYISSQGICDRICWVSKNHKKNIIKQIGCTWFFNQNTI